MAFHSDYEEIFLLKDDAAKLLSKAGFPIDLGSNSQDQESAEAVGRQDNHQEWMKLYAAKSSLRLYEAAFLLHSKEPPDNEPRSIAAAPREVFKAQGVLYDLVITGDIETFNTHHHIDDEPSTWLLDHNSVLAWCQRTGYKWPLADLMTSGNAIESAPENQCETSDQDKPSHGIDEPVRQRLSNLEEEIATLKEKLEALSALVPLHPEGLMKMAVEVQHDYWQSPGEVRPKAEVIVRDLRDKHPEISDAQARAVEKVACPVHRNRGG
jgi:hypothetical protein